MALPADLTGAVNLALAKAQGTCLDSARHYVAIGPSEVLQDPGMTVRDRRRKDAGAPERASRPDIH